MNEALVQIGALDPAVGNFVFPLVQALDAHPALHTVFTIIALLGSEYFYIPAVLLIFWCIDRERGFKLGQLVLVSAWINGWLRACRIEAWYDLPSPAVQVSLLLTQRKDDSGSPRKTGSTKSFNFVSNSG